MQVKAAELASVQRLEAAELRKQEEKARRLEQARARASAETHLREKVAAATFARGYIKGMHQMSPHICSYICKQPLNIDKMQYVKLCRYAATVRVHKYMKNACNLRLLVQLVGFQATCGICFRVDGHHLWALARLRLLL